MPEQRLRKLSGLLRTSVQGGRIREPGQELEGIMKSRGKVVRSDPTWEELRRREIAGVQEFAGSGICGIC